MPYQVDTALLASLVRNHRGTRTLREAADDIMRLVGSISPATLLRIEQGKLPDLPVFLHLCNWLDVSLACLLYSTSPAPVPASDTAATVARLLRSDSRLAPAMANVLAVMVEATYTQLAGRTTNE